MEKTESSETWRVTEQGLEITEARVKGSGAGMDPGEGARLEDGWWNWSPEMPVVPELVLASSGATMSSLATLPCGRMHRAGRNCTRADTNVTLPALIAIGTNSVC